MPCFPRRDHTAFTLRSVLSMAAVLGAAGALAPGHALADPWAVPIAASPTPTDQPTGPVARSVQTLAAQVGPAAFTAPTWHPGLLRHVVLFRFRDTTTTDQKAEVVRRYLRLVQDSRRPDGHAVVQSIDGGRQNSGEASAAPYDLGFVVTFASEGDRNYFVGAPVVTAPGFFDPAHQAFKDYVAPLVDGVSVFDFDVAETASSVVPRAAARHR
ncbi:Dabb family protein [Ameyamaea chiangmaiensis]|uniref:Dabb family protein n=2 Tax=Ameyamaea chiangmaiensis TaxID=442969 RepID=A0A850PGK0_9PROT|nr:Dabb family protein [Ameyamaea chiangmaiensis]NVN41356.1 Dabb family protein [Ameyamaea chiangmaiensis]